ncbi:MAG: PAS domain S-box protein [Proteobacteria bacterium]|nr:PAS domain S-box protein [Pseudomonadota bacterium]
MSSSKKLSPEIIGQIAILQSMVTLLPDETSMLNFICQGLKDVAGVKRLTYRLFHGETPSSSDSALHTETMEVFQVKYKAVTYAELYFDIAESDSFEPYVPFLKNFTNMLAVIFEERKQRALNKTLMEELEQRVAERTRELKEKKEDLRITLNSIGDAVISTDIHGNVSNMNPVAEKLTGWNAAEGKGKPLTEVFCIVNTHTMQPVLNPVKKVLDTGEMVGLANHTSLISRNGSHYQIADSAAPIRDFGGRIRGVVLVFRDVSEEYRIAEALKISEEKYRKIVEETGDLITRTDENGILTYVNQCAERIFGIPAAQCIGKKALEFVHPEDREKTETWLRGCVDNRLKQSSFENRQVHHVTKEIFQFLWTCNFHYDNKGCLLLVNGVAHDITERKHAEEEKSKLELQLQQAQKMESVGQLAGGVAHDFNNMLGVILGHAEMAMVQLDPMHPIFDNLEEIRRAANRSADITRQLLAFARKQSVEPKVLDLNETVEGMLKMLRRLIGENIDLVWMPGTGLWQINQDPSQIDQILANLCVNARDAISDVGKITVETENCTFGEDFCAVHKDVMPGEYVRISVSDNGCGVDKETLSHIFEPFFTTKDIGKGTGLGLATVYGAVRQNNGFINVYSEPGQGTTLSIYLPRHADTADLASSDTKEEFIEGGHETILLVEDEPAVLKMTTIMLKLLGYTVLVAATPSEALRLIEDHAIDIHLLFTDVIMPEMNGRVLAKKLLAIYPHLKCLFMSGYTSDIIDQQDILDEGVQFIQKPFSKSDLANKVRSVLGQKSPKNFI